MRCMQRTSFPPRPCTRSRRYRRRRPQGRPPSRGRSGVVVGETCPGAVWRLGLWGALLPSISGARMLKWRPRDPGGCLRGCRPNIGTGCSMPPQTSSTPPRTSASPTTPRRRPQNTPSTEPTPTRTTAARPTPIADNEISVAGAGNGTRPDPDQTPTPDSRRVHHRTSPDHQEGADIATPPTPTADRRPSTRPVRPAPRSTGAHLATDAARNILTDLERGRPRTPPT